MTVNAMPANPHAADARADRPLPRSLVVGLIGFLTLVDLFAAQAILPTLVQHYGVSDGAMGLAVNASTFGMAASSLLVSLFARRIDRRRGIWLSLALLSLPTMLLASAPDLATFTVLRVAQGVFMASAFTLTMAYLAERGGPRDTAAALAAYVTGIVASNLIGRIVSGSVAEMAGLAATFWVFAGLNLAGALLAAWAVRPDLRMVARCVPSSPALRAWLDHLADPILRATFGIGFLILFVFIATFTYVNFELARDPVALAPMDLGFVYLVFLPALVTTPLAGRAAGRWGARRMLLLALGACIAALPLLVVPSLAAILTGLTVIGVGTFFAQAIATGVVGHAARSDRAAASGLYLAAYYLGGLAGAALLGQVYDRLGWAATAAGVGVALGLALALSARIAPRAA